jgi:hypothetical protein
MCGLLWAAGNAQAEGGTCPDGYYPIGGQGVQGCAPIPGYGQQAAQPAQPYWVDRYGAVAWDVNAPEDAGIGISANQRSRRKAEKLALAQCAKQGGSKQGCELIKTFWNGCMAMAKGASGIRSPHVAGTEMQAMASAMKACKSDTTDCKVLHSVCSMPVLVR